MMGASFLSWVLLNASTVVDPLAAYAAPPEYCQLEDNTAARKVSFKGTPMYFAKANMLTTRNRLYFKLGNNNVALNLSTGATQVLPGNIDPVPTPDGEYITLPGVEFYDADSSEGNPSSPSKFRSTQQGPYQSIGLLNSSNAEKNYRVITDMNPAVNGFKYKDIRVSGAKGTESFAVAADGVLCKTIDGQAAPNFKLPMISKDGFKISAYDLSTGTTKIFSINPNNPESCSLLVDLGMPTGKMEFNRENNKVAFHVDEGGATNGDWFMSPRYESRLNIYTYDLNSKEITRVSNNVKGNSYYPSFRADGTIVYLHNEPGKDYAAIIADPSRGQRMKLPNDCLPSDENFQAAVALGALWMRVCNAAVSPALTPVNIALIPMSLSPEKCRALVKANWRQLKGVVGTNVAVKKSPELANSLSGISENDVIAACPSEEKPTSRPEEVSDENQSAPPASVNIPNMMANCAGCHHGAVGTLPPFPPMNDIMYRTDWLNMDAGNGKTWKQRLRETLSPGGKMAEAGNFNQTVPNAEDRKRILEELSR